jgi:hypothetical protein
VAGSVAKAASLSRAAKRMPLGKTVRLRGTLWPEKHYGAPGYGEDKAHDPLLTIYALRLDAPIDLISSDDPTVTANIAPIERIQVNFNDADDKRADQAARDELHV